MKIRNSTGVITLAVIIFFICLPELKAEIKVGLARKEITPPLPFWLSGYARQTKSNEVVQPLWAKVAVFEESPWSRVVIVTTDILGLSHEISENVAARINKSYGIPRSQLLMNSSHTHSGPVIWPNLSNSFELSSADLTEVSLYSQKLSDDIVELIGSALSNLAPAVVTTGHGTASFAVNRRLPTDNGIIIGVNPSGPVDHDVPVIKVAAPDGKIRAVLFGYACHNTTSGTNLINGDYAGFAQAEMEKTYPGITAMYMIGCGADQNPNPRGSVEIAAQYGRRLAESVGEVLKKQMQPVNPPIRSYYTTVNLDFKTFDPEIYRKDIVSTNSLAQKRANRMLEAYNKGWVVSHYPYPVQAVRFGNDLTILALSGEIVIDYALRAKNEYPGENMFVAGYCNEVMCYIPSERVLMEGGYEADRSMQGYGFPGPFAAGVEEKIFSAIHLVMDATGAHLNHKNK